MIEYHIHQSILEVVNKPRNIKKRKEKSYLEHSFAHRPNNIHAIPTNIYTTVISIKAKPNDKM
jgi:hypothetical protein